MRCWIAELTGGNPDTGADETVYVGTHRLPPFPPTDPDRPGQHYRAWLLEPANVEQDEVDGEASAGGGGGEIVVSAAAAELSAYADWAWDGRRARVWRGEVGAAWADFELVLDATIQDVEWAWGRDRAPQLTYRVRDRGELLAVPLQLARYAGTNDGTTGDEGTADDLEGQVKPLRFGFCRNARFYSCNIAADRWQCHDGEINDVTALYTRRSALTRVASDPQPGEWSLLDASQGIVQLGGAAGGDVTGNVQGDAAGGYVDRIGAVIVRLLSRRLGWGSAEIDTAAFDALDTAYPYAVGISIESDRQLDAVIQELLASVGGWADWTTDGEYTCGLLEAPAGDPVISLGPRDLVNVDRESTRLPVSEVVAYYQPNWTVMGRNELAGVAIEAGDLAWVEQQWRQVTVSDQAVADLHPLARTLELHTLFDSKAAAEGEAQRHLDLHSVRRDWLSLVTELRPETEALRRQDVISVTFPAFGYETGRPMRVVGRSPNTPEPGQMTLKVWG